METQALIGMLVIGSVVIGGLVLAYGLARFAFPYRVRMYEIGTDLLSHGRLAPQQRRTLKFVLDYGASFRAGWVVLFAVAWVTLDKLKGVSSESDVTYDSDYVKVMGLFFLSSLAANPVALIMTIPFGIGLIAVAKVREDERPKQAFRDAAMKTPVAKQAIFA